MREGSSLDRFILGMSRDLQRVANKISPVAPRVMQRFSDTSRRGLIGLYNALWRFAGGLRRRNWIAIAAFLVAVVSAFYTFRQAEYTHEQVELTRQSLKQHLDPEISCQLDGIRDQFPTFTLENVGFITAESVSVDHLTFRYRKTSMQKVTGGFDLPVSGRPGFRWLYVPSLEPNERTPPKQTGRFVPPPESPESKEEIAILFFEVSYLRPTDGRRYEKRCVFYNSKVTG